MRGGGGRERQHGAVETAIVSNKPQMGIYGLLQTSLGKSQTTPHCFEQGLVDCRSCSNGTDLGRTGSGRNGSRTGTAIRAPRMHSSIRYIPPPPPPHPPPPLPPPQVRDRGARRRGGSAARRSQSPPAWPVGRFKIQRFEDLKVVNGREIQRRGRGQRGWWGGEGRGVACMGEGSGGEWGKGGVIEGVAVVSIPII